MNQNQLGENIAKFRKAKGLSQEKVAEVLEVSRQAVTKWESNISRPSSENLIKLADTLGVSVDVLLGNDVCEDANEEEGVGPDKTPWIFIGISAVCFISYMIISNLLDVFVFGTLVCMFIIWIPIQLFLHVYFSNAIKQNSYTGIAGFSEKIEYHYPEVKKLLVQMDLHIGMSSTVYLFLMCVLGCAKLRIPWMNAFVFIVYILNFIAIILFNNYRFIDKIYCNEVDKKRSVKGIPITIIYFVLILVGMGMTILVYEVKGIENNTLPAMKAAGTLMAGLLFATIGFFVENHNVNKWNPDKESYKVNKVSIVSFLLCLVFYGLMCVV
ncbi:MAG: helix-turn-helix transcriptional regulator [Lachnospiraceae bacterium]|nr:helix-turn-helix transcriptional regulator [Lachnospiraceae bacterium]